MQARNHENSDEICAQPVRHLDLATPAFYTYRKNPKCYHTVWGKNITFPNNTFTPTPTFQGSHHHHPVSPSNGTASKVTFLTFDPIIPASFYGCDHSGREHLWCLGEDLERMDLLGKEGREEGCEIGNTEILLLFFDVFGKF